MQSMFNESIENYLTPSEIELLKDAGFNHGWVRSKLKDAVACAWDEITERAYKRIREMKYEEIKKLLDEFEPERNSK